jgi:hypothetical protein
MPRFNILLVAAAAALLGSSAATARPKRTVVLLDFSRAQMSPMPAVDAPQSSLDVDAVSRVMASQFTGAAGSSGAMDATFPPSPTPSAMNLSALGNPFVSHAAMSGSPLPSVAHLGASDCLVASYQPSSGFGRSAEQRRRIIFPLVHRVACETGLPVGLFDAMIMQESRYQANAISPKGAVGLAQLMPGTAQQLRVDRYSLLENLRGGARYLKQHIDRFGRYDLALAAYNAGPGRVERRWQVPQIAETQNYVRTILGNWQGTAVASASVARPLTYRQAQMIFMAYRGGND